MTGAHPLLLPAGIPSSWSALVTTVTPSFFDVTYRSGDGTKIVNFAIQVPNPPPPGPHASQTSPKFHGDRHSAYVVDDATNGTSPRTLIWNEPGTWSEPNGRLGVPYVLYTIGLTDTEFWAIANSVSS